MQALLRKEDRHAWLLLLGLFLLWNLRLANVAAQFHQHIVRSELLLLIAWKTVFFVGLCLCLYWVFQNLRQTLLSLSVFVVFWLLGGALIDAAMSRILFRLSTQLALFGAATFIVSYAVNHHIDLFSRLVAVFAAVMFCIQVPGLYAVLSTQKVANSLTGLETDLPAEISETLPHIIYIVPDRYSSNANLEALYGFSNTRYTSELRARGFHVWDDQNANYPKTFLSLASTLNADYLDAILPSIPKAATSQSYMSSLIKDSAARRALQARGYSYTHIGAWWGPTKTNPWADQNFRDATMPFGNLTTTYIQVTPLRSLLALTVSRKTPCDVIDDKVALVHRQVQSLTPQFVFWHNMVTHDPYIYEADGSCRSVNVERHFTRDYDARTDAYLSHIEHFNQLSLDLIDSVFRDASRDVIFVIQSDEGPFPQAYLDQISGLTQKPYNFLETSNQEMKRKQGVFNAMHLPSQDYVDAQSLTTPVNNFRLIFRELTGQPIPLLPDRSYSFEHDGDPYDLTDISHELRAPD